MRGVLFVFCLLALAMPVGATIINVPGDYSTIQAAITAANPGDEIDVHAGTYPEYNILVNKGLTIKGDDKTTTFIDGSAATASGSVVNISLTSGDVLFDGFTIKTGTSLNGISAKSTSYSSIITIKNNKIVGFGPTATGDNFGLIAQNSNASLIFQYNEITQCGSNSILLERHMGATDVSYNTWDRTSKDEASDGYFNMNYGGIHSTNLQKVSNNTIDMSAGTTFDNSTRGAGISFAGAYTGTLGGFTKVEIRDNTVKGLKPYRRGISLWNNGPSGYGSYGEISAPVITGNTIEGTAGNTGSYGIRLLGLVSNARIESNSVDSVETGFRGQAWNGHICTGTIISYNSFTNISLNLDWQGTTTLDASSNWWGDYTPAGVAGKISGPVDYTPWLHYGTNTPPNPGDPGFYGDYSYLHVDDTSPQTDTTGRIQEGINLVTGSTVQVEAGTYNENVALNKKITLQGVGSGTSGSIIAPTSGNGINVYGGGGGGGAGDRTIVKDLRITCPMYGINMLAAVSYLTFDNIYQTGGTEGFEVDQGGSPPAAIYNDIIIDNCSFVNNSGMGFRCGRYSSIVGLKVTDSHFDGNNRGFYDNMDASGTPSVLTQVSISNTTFNKNANRGMYLEKLDNATFTSVQMDSNGNPNANNYEGGADINLKYGNYQNLVFDNCEAIGNAPSNTTNSNGFTVKGRNDGSYSSNPAHLDGLHFIGGTYETPNSSRPAIAIGNNVSTITFSGGTQFTRTGVGLSVYTDPSSPAIDLGDASFAGSLAYYIGVSTAMNVNGTGAYFNGLMGSGMTLAELYATEDKILHKIDYSGAGFVTVKAQNDYVTPASYLPPYTTAPSVQRGIDAASAGWIVNVDAGFYNERLTISKSLDIRGAQYLVDPTPAGERINPAEEAVVDLTGLPVTNPNVLVEIPTGAKRVSLDGFTLIGSETFHYADEAVVRFWDDDINLSNNIMDGYYPVLCKGSDTVSVGQNRMTTNKTGITVQPNPATMVNIFGNLIMLGPSPASDAQAIYMANSSNCTVDANMADNFPLRAFSGSNLTKLVLVGNSFIGDRDAISIWGSSTFIAIVSNLLSSSSRYGINIKAQDVEIMRNEILDDSVGVNVDKNVLETKRITVSCNDIVGNFSYGVYVTSLVTDTVAGINNWWGDASGPYHPTLNPAGTGDRVGDRVTFDPWLKNPVGDICPPENHRPVCDGDGPYAAECAGGQGTDVKLDGTGSYDPDQDLLLFNWSAPGVVFDDPTSPTPTGAFPLGATDVTLIVSDGALADTCSTTVEVGDTTPPVITCPPDDTLDAKGECEAIYEGPSATARDICDSEVNIGSDPALPATFSGAGTYTITWIATDGSGNADTCVQRIIVVDETPPEITCPRDTTLEVNGGCQATYGGPKATAIDNCDSNPTITSTPPVPARLVGVGDHTIEWIATDSSGNADTCYQTVKLVDKTRPVITCPPDTVLRANGNCQVAYAGPRATATDNCDANPKITSVPPVPATFTGLGTYTITWTAADSSGNKSSCDQKITVIDVKPPTIVCPRDSIMEGDGNCQVVYSGPPATALDNCDSKPKVTSLPPLPAIFTGVGSYTITWTATDTSGNSSSCDQKITVIDKTAPVITCPKDSIMKADASCRVTYSGPPATALDNCDASPKITSVPSLPAVFAGVGTYTISWTATDVSGNKSSCDQKITVIDAMAPVITCPRDTTLHANGNCQVTYSGPPATALDNCDANPKITSVPPVPATFTGLGTYTITWTATDVSGNKSSCDQKITVIDVKPPTIVCPRDSIMQADGNCQVTYSGPPATALDNCDSKPKITSLPPVPATFTGVGTYIITWTATDASGNSSSCDQKITVIDKTAPVITCPKDSVMKADANCKVTYSGPPATALDNCDAAPKITSVPTLPAVFAGVGTYTISWTAIDVSGNKSSCDQKITVIDATAPVITCPRDTTLHANGNCQVSYSGPLATALDNCDASPKITSFPPVPATFTGLGTYTITWTATDVSGNESSCDQKITVIDVKPPIIVCPKDSIMQADGSCQVTYSGPPAAALDNCDSKPKITSVPPVPATFTGVGTYIITWTATDASGNSSSCDQKITVIDKMAPVITCPEDVSLSGDDNCEVVYAGPSATALDNCDASPTVTSVPPLPASFSGVGGHEIVYTATDVSGNISSCTQRVTITDVTPPVVICPRDTSIAAESLDCSVTYDGPAATAFDNCDGNPVVTSDPALPATFYSTGNHEIVFTAVDASGNTSVCRMTVTVLITSYCYKSEAIGVLQALVPSGSKEVDRKIKESLEHVWHSLNVDPKHPGKPWKDHPLWVNPTHLDTKHGHYVFDEEKEAVKKLVEAMKEKSCPPDILDDLQNGIFALVNCDEMLASVQIQDAKNAGGDPKEIAKAEKEMVKADQERAKGKYDEAIEHYKKAWEHAVKAMGKFSLAGGQSAIEKASAYTFALSQNNPNPFSKETSIAFSVPAAGHIALSVFDASGRVVATLVDKEMAAGAYSVTWDRANAASGIYFYRLSSNGSSLTRKMVVVR